MDAMDYCPPLSGGLGWAVRLSVLWTCASVLIVKKVSYEKDTRRWKDFLLDSAKQVIGAFWAFVLSVPTVGCGDYWTGTMLETTLGVLVEYLALVFLSRLFAQASGNPKAFKTGEYLDSEGQFRRRLFVMQLVLWLLCVTCMKFVTVAIAATYREAAEERLLKVLASDRRAELVLVVLVTPCVMRGLQVWLTDDFLKKDGAPSVCSQCLRWKATRGRRATSASASSATAPLIEPKAKEPKARGDPLAIAVGTESEEEEEQDRDVEQGKNHGQGAVNLPGVGYVPPSSENLRTQADTKVLCQTPKFKNGCGGIDEEDIVFTVCLTPPRQASEPGPEVDVFKLHHAEDSQSTIRRHLSDPSNASTPPKAAAWSASSSAMEGTPCTNAAAEVVAKAAAVAVETAGDSTMVGLRSDDASVVYQSEISVMDIPAQVTSRGSNLGAKRPSHPEVKLDEVLRSRTTELMESEDSELPWAAPMSADGRREYENIRGARSPRGGSGSSDLEATPPPATGNLQLKSVHENYYEDTVKLPSLDSDAIARYRQERKGSAEM